MFTTFHPNMLYDGTRLCPTQEGLKSHCKIRVMQHCSPDTGGKATASRSQGGLPVPDPRTRPSMRRLMYSPFSGFLLAVFICVWNQLAQSPCRSAVAFHLHVQHNYSHTVSCKPQSQHGVTNTQTGVSFWLLARKTDTKKVLVMSHAGCRCP